MKFKDIKIGQTYQIIDLFGDLVNVEITCKEKRKGMYFVYYNYTDYYMSCTGAKKGLQASETPEIKNLYQISA